MRPTEKKRREKKYKENVTTRTVLRQVRQVGRISARRRNGSKAFVQVSDRLNGAYVGVG